MHVAYNQPAMRNMGLPIWHQENTYMFLGHCVGRCQNHTLWLFHRFLVTSYHQYDVIISLVTSSHICDVIWTVMFNGHHSGRYGERQWYVLICYTGNLTTDSPMMNNSSAGLQIIMYYCILHPPITRGSHISTILDFVCMYTYNTFRSVYYMGLLLGTILLPTLHGIWKRYVLGVCYCA